MQAVTWLTITGAFVLGVVLALLGSLKLILAKRLQIGEARVGGLVSALNLALVPAMLLSGILLDSWGVQWVLMLGCLLTGLAVWSFTVAQSYKAALGSVLLLGSGAACLSAATIVLMPRAFFGENDQVAASLNLGNVFFALGALMTPTLIELMLRTLRYRWTLGILAGLCLVPAIQAFFVPWAEFPTESGTLESVLRDPKVWLAGVAFGLYAPIEFCLSTWATTYLTDFGYRERRAAWLLSGFWFMFLAGRVLMAALEYASALPRGSEPWLLLILAVLTAVVLGNLIGAAEKKQAAWGLLLLGFLLGPAFPLLVGLVFETVSMTQRGTAYGAMFAIGSLGSFALAPLVGNMARRRTVQQALRIPLIMAFMLVVASLVLALV